MAQAHSVMRTSSRACFLCFFYNPYMSRFNSKTFTCILDVRRLYIHVPSFVTGAHHSRYNHSYQQCHHYMSTNLALHLCHQLCGVVLLASRHYICWLHRHNVIINVSYYTCERETPDTGNLCMIMHAYKLRCFSNLPILSNLANAVSYS